jgi:membrane protein
MIDPPERGPGLLARALGFARAVARRFWEDGCLLHASALTYTTLLSLVPLLALMFAVLKGLGVQRRLEPLLLSRLSLDPETTKRVLTYIDHTNVRTLGALGAAALVVSVISVLGSIEGSFNHIWQVRRGRTWWRKATDYFGAVLITPVLLLAAVGITSSVREQAVLRWILRTEYVGQAVVWLLSLAPVVINAVALGILYAVMPNRRPHVASIVAGAIAAGCAWQVVQREYVSLQIGVAHYDAIYGALAQLPVTLVWIYVSWVVVLAGAELAVVWERGPQSAGATATMYGGAVALHVLLRAAERFRSGGGPIVPQPLAHELRVDRALVAEIAERLHRRGLLVAIEGAEEAYVLARDPATIDFTALPELLTASDVPPGCDPRVRTQLDQLLLDQQAQLRLRSLADLCGPTVKTAG